VAAQEGVTAAEDAAVRNMTPLVIKNIKAGVPVHNISTLGKNFAGVPQAKAVLEGVEENFRPTEFVHAALSAAEAEYLMGELASAGNDNQG
jgi:hypothetical protein